MSKRLNGKQYFFDKATKMLKSHGLMFIDRNRIVPIKSFNKFMSDYKKKLEKIGDDENKKEDLNRTYSVFIGSLHKESYWDILPKSYKNIIKNPEKYGLEIMKDLVIEDMYGKRKIIYFKKIDDGDKDDEVL